MGEASLQLSKKEMKSLSTSNFCRNKPEKQSAQIRRENLFSSLIKKGEMKLKGSLRLENNTWLDLCTVR